MELRTLRYFAAAVEEGSLTAAAERLHLAQPSHSVAISRLETEVGVPLLKRTSRGVQPTSAGRYLLDAASRVLGDVDEIRRTLADFGSGEAGSLALAAVPVLMWHRVPRLLRDFAKAVPSVDVQVSDPPPWTAIDLLQERRVDAAAVVVAQADRFIKRLGPEFDVYDWGEVPLVAVLPPGEAGDQGSITGTPTNMPETGPLPVSAFAGRTLVLPHRTAAVPSLPEAVDEVLLGVELGRVRSAPTIQASLPLIEAGLASAILPDPDRQSLARFNVTVRELDPAPEPLRALIVVRREGSRNPAMSRLLEFVAPTNQSGGQELASNIPQETSHTRE